VDVEASVFGEYGLVAVKDGLEILVEVLLDSLLILGVVLFYIGVCDLIGRCLLIPAHQPTLSRLNQLLLLQLELCLHFLYFCLLLGNEFIFLGPCIDLAL
jgi:hypothetical protein